MAKVLTVGGGIGGMAASIKLGQSGHEVEIIDLDPDWKVYGAGITITGPTLRAYKHLDMVDDIATTGAITSGSRIFKFDGTFLRDLDEPPLEDGLPATGGIMRPLLHELMQRRVRALEQSVRLGLTVDGFDQDEDGVSVTFSDGSSDRYDLVIGADSLNSRVRELAFPHAVKPHQTGQGCWRISMRKPPGMDRGEMYFGYPDRTAGITPCGEDAVYLWLLTPHTEGDYVPAEETYDRLKELLAPYGGSAGWMRDNLTRDDWINFRPLASAIQPRPWHMGRIVLLGDAVHATTPHLASGAGMAVESAVVLAEEMEKAAGDVRAALAAYEERRFARCKDIVDSSVDIGNHQLSGAAPDVIGMKIGQALHRLAAPF